MEMLRFLFAQGRVKSEICILYLDKAIYIEDLRDTIVEGLLNLPKE